MQLILIQDSSYPDTVIGTPSTLNAQLEKDMKMKIIHFAIVQNIPCFVLM